jgi:hypothetical protein
MQRRGTIRRGEEPSPPKAWGRDIGDCLIETNADPDCASAHAQCRFRGVGGVRTAASLGFGHDQIPPTGNPRRRLALDRTHDARWGPAHGPASDEARARAGPRRRRAPGLEAVGSSVWRCSNEGRSLSRTGIMRQVPSMSSGAGTPEAPSMAGGCRDQPLP